jgi:hypothetical protein
VNSKINDERLKEIERIEKKYNAVALMFDGKSAAYAARMLGISYCSIGGIFRGVCRNLNKNLYESLREGTYLDPELKILIRNKTGFIGDTSI